MFTLLSYCFLHSTLWGGCYNPHFIEGETEVVVNCTVFAKVVQLITVLSRNPRSSVFRYLLISFPPNHTAFLVVAVACRMLTESRGNGGCEPWWMKQKMLTKDMAVQFFMHLGLWVSFCVTDFRMMWPRKLFTACEGCNWEAGAGVVVVHMLYSGDESSSVGCWAEDDI